jgi:hypothetical protein
MRFFVTNFADFWPRVAVNEQLRKMQCWKATRNFSQVQFCSLGFGSEEFHPAGRQFTEMPAKEFCYFSPFSSRQLDDFENFGGDFVREAQT